MFSLRWMLATTLCLVCLSASQAGNIDVKIYTSSAPNVFGSPNWSTYQTNAVNALRNGLSSAGIANTPGYYSQGTTFTPGQIVATTFNSWNGDANPGTTFGAAFANEYGNRLHYGLAVKAGTGTTFQVQDIEYGANSPSEWNALGTLNLGGTFSAGSIYAVDEFGTVYTGGNIDAINLKEFYYVGIGEAFEANSLSELTSTLGELQNRAPFAASSYYSIKDSDGVFHTANASVVITPEPASMAVFGLAVVGVVAGRIRRRRVTA